MHFSLLLPTFLAWAYIASAKITWSLQKVPIPTDDQADAYERIEAALGAAVARYRRFVHADKHLTALYLPVPGVPTAEANIDGFITYGKDRTYMTERTTLHEISHTLGIGTGPGWDRMCFKEDWPTALPLLRSFDGKKAEINCDTSHFWPYGLNYNKEWSDENADRHCQMVQAMIDDGINDLL